jgi:hypothetical protein
LEYILEPKHICSTYLICRRHCALFDEKSARYHSSNRNGFFLHNLLLLSIVEANKDPFSFFISKFIGTRINYNYFHKNVYVSKYVALVRLSGNMET